MCHRYLLEAKGLSDYAHAAARVSGLELGGLVGSLLAGRLSDTLIARAAPDQGLVGRRLLVVRGYLVGLGTPRWASNAGRPTASAHSAWKLSAHLDTLDPRSSPCCDISGYTRLALEPRLRQAGCCGR